MISNATREIAIDIRTSFGRKLSNMYLLKTPLTDEYGIEYWTVENAYQAAKTDSLIEKKRIATLLVQSVQWAGLAAKAAGRRVTMSKGFDNNKVNIMKALLKEKFKDDIFKSVLVSTGTRPIVEFDRKAITVPFWSIDKNGNGKNMMGILLEELRETLK